MIGLGWSRGGPGYRARSGADAAIVGNLLVWARAEVTDAGVSRVVLRADGTGDCNEYPIGVRDPNFVPNQAPDYFHAGSYPGCYRHGTPYIPPAALSADGVAITAAALPGTPSVDGLLVVTNAGGSLYWSRIAYTSNPATPTETSETVDIANAGLTTGASTSPGRREPALTRNAATNEVLLVFVNALGNVRQASLAGSAGTWSSVTNATTSSGPIMSGSAVDLVVFNGSIHMAVTRQTTGIVELYRLATSGSPLAARTWSLARTFTRFQTFRRPTLAIARDARARSSWRLTMLMAGTDGRMYWSQSPLDTVGLSEWDWSAEVYDGSTGAVMVESLAAIYDGRAIVPDHLRDLRVYTASAHEVGCTVDSCPLGQECMTFSGRALCARSGDPMVNYDMNPFPTGRAAGVHADYDDWDAMWYGLCASIQGAAFDHLPIGSPYRPVGATRYLAVEQTCGTLPVWPEPSPGGMPILAWPPLGDSTAHPDLYTGSEVSCP